MNRDELLEALKNYRDIFIGEHICRAAALYIEELEKQNRQLMEELSCKDIWNFFKIII